MPIRDRKMPSPPSIDRMYLPERGASLEVTTDSSVFAKAKAAIGNSFDGSAFEPALSTLNQEDLGFPAAVGTVRINGELCLKGDLFIGKGTHLFVDETVSITGRLYGEGSISVDGLLSARAIDLDGDVCCLELNLYKEARIGGY